MLLTQKAVAKRLVATQEALGLKSAVICKEIGISPNRWSQYTIWDEKHSRMIPPDIATRLKQRYGITTDWIYAGDPTNLPDKIRTKIAPTAA